MTPTAASETHRYAVLLWPDESGSWGATVPSLPGCVAVGDSREEALDLIRGAIQMHLEGMCEEGIEIPVDDGSRAPEAIVVTVRA